MAAARLFLIVLAHRNPHQVRRLVDWVGRDRTLLHLDAALSDAVTAEFSELVGPVATVRRRQPSAWASWGIVEAALQGAMQAVRDGGATHVGVVSGQDYPLVPVDYAESLLRPGESLARAVPLPLERFGPAGGFDRLRYRHWPVHRRKVRLPIPRRLPDDLLFAAGAPWSIYAANHVERAVEYADQHREWWRRVWIPDELFLPTFLATFVPDHLVNWAAHYTEWQSGSAHPHTFVVEDVPRLTEVADTSVEWQPGRKWFARKFDDEDGLVADALAAASARQVLSGTPLPRPAETTLGLPPKRAR